MSTPYIVSLSAKHLTLIVTQITVFAGALAAGLAGFAFSAITGAVLFHINDRRFRQIVLLFLLFSGITLMA